VRCSPSSSTTPAAPPRTPERALPLKSMSPVGTSEKTLPRLGSRCAPTAERWRPCASSMLTPAAPRSSSTFSRTSWLTAVPPPALRLDAEVGRPSGTAGAAGTRGEPAPCRPPRLSIWTASWCRGSRPGSGNPRLSRAGFSGRSQLTPRRLAERGLCRSLLSSSSTGGTTRLECVEGQVGTQASELPTDHAAGEHVDDEGAWTQSVNVRQ
jgi:hypothetical protein